jgi:hypothetical protein
MNWMPKSAWAAYWYNKLSKMVILNGQAQGNQGQKKIPTK